MKFNATDKIIVLGTSGCGKSYLAEKLFNIYPRVIIFDSLGEYNDEGGEIVHGFNDFTDNLLKNKNSKSFKTTIQFEIEDGMDNEEIDEILRCIYYRGNVLLFIDEIQNFTTIHNIPFWLKNIIFHGRHQNIGLIFSTQRPGQLNKNLLSQATKVFCGNLHEKNDIKVMSNYLGKTDEDIANLEFRKFIFWTPGHESIIINNDLTTTQGEFNETD